METSEIKFLRSVKSCTRLDHIQNDIRHKLNVQLITKLAKENRKYTLRQSLRLES